MWELFILKELFGEIMAHGRGRRVKVFGGAPTPSP